MEPKPEHVPLTRNELRTFSPQADVLTTEANQLGLKNILAIKEVIQKVYGLLDYFIYKKLCNRLTYSMKKNQNRDCLEAGEEEE